MVRYIRLIDTNVYGSKYDFMQEVEISGKGLTASVLHKFSNAMKECKANGGNSDQIFDVAIQVLEADGYTVDRMYPITTVKV